ncbi:zf-HC2 domain-containing protein [Allopontixanthobacter sp.]|uniref:zf-HC2 domain-containing protein n=1 Tax=Allopontixanthobacter sp. TaxID=2906452 RepID=UPI003A0FD6DF
MLNCHDATFLLSQRLERDLSVTERANLRLHVTICRGCTNFERQLPTLGKAARAFASHDPGAEDSSS